MSILMQPIAQVRGGRSEVRDDRWGDVQAVIELDRAQFDVDALAGLDAFSHAIVVYVFDQVAPERIETGARHPRNNAAWPKVGIFAQRGKNRPNRIGVSTCRILRVEGLQVFVQGLDAIDGTPVLDIKPYMRAFDPRGAVHEPEWVREIMAEYW